jgi:putative phosphoribosyl transferase
MVITMPPTRFADRAEAGRLLAVELERRGELPTGAVVLGIPRGGVTVAAEVARRGDLALDVALARKVGAPGNRELAIGAVGPDGRAMIEMDIAQRLVRDSRWLEDAVGRARAEVAERVRRFRGDRPPLDFRGRDVVVIDDGVATGSTALAVGQWLREAGAGRAILAVPVGPPATIARLRDVYDDVIALLVPEPFYAVGEFYVDFRQVTDEEVAAVLA